MVNLVESGVCAPKGFRAAGVHCGIRRNKTKSDLAMIVSDVPCAAAGVYTTNKVKGAPLAVTKAHLADGYAQAVICNSGNANTCAPNGVWLAETTCELTAEALGLKPEDIIVSSTGVIGEELTIDPFKRGIPELVKKLAYNGSDAAAYAIMTTDTIKKEVAVFFEIGGKMCRMGAIAKGSGMINPNMATMLCFITTDCAITPALLQKALSESVKDTFNQISVDGDTSTNDSVFILANGMAENEMIADENSEEFKIFCEALNMVGARMARYIASDGEGATKLLECTVKGAPDHEVARVVSKTVIQSSLLKAAMFGEDANWGRVLCAVGYAKADFDISKIEVQLASGFGSVTVCKDAKYHDYSEDMAAEILTAKEIQIIVDLHQGEGTAKAWGCDLTYDYVKINGDYRT
ncbi:MAG: bifunctional glutamate N-acetyltransferase/amino-acid acetyltransferase ArgJ [Clostridiales bacterium]|nr:bifunctional glutamate N-acetyltransferase/amino-acid acetyltransferase ArgJ [Clostridiales bacterium]